jgi:hypothetical protein
MSSMQITPVPAAAVAPRSQAVAAPRDADGDHDGSVAGAAASAPKSAPLAAAGQPGSTLHVLA